MQLSNMQAVARVLSQLSPEVQGRFNEQYSSLRTSAAAIGEELPAISLVGVLEGAPLPEEAQEEAAEPVNADISTVSLLILL